jgi:Zn-dependent protease
VVRWKDGLVIAGGPVEGDRAEFALWKDGTPIAEPHGPGENHRLMHEQRPSEVEGEYLPPAPPHAAPPKRGWRTAGGVLGALAILALKFKGLLLLVLNLKWLLFVPKLLFSFGSLFVSIWFYALFFGWKFGVVFVLLILVHELGHYVTFRNLGISAGLPFFIPGLGAFVAARGPAPSMTIEAIATIAGPVYGLAAAGVCYALARNAHDPFWYAAAYVGFFLNALNLLPIPPFDGGRLAGIIDPRLWILGLAGFLAWIVFFHAWSSPFSLLFLIVVGVVAVPRIRALFAGYVDPRFAAVPPASRVAIAVAYFATLAIAVGGAAVTYFDPRHM